RADPPRFPSPPLFRSSFGDPAAVVAMLDRLGAAIAAAGVRRVAVQSPSCAHLLATHAPGPAGVAVEPLAGVLAAGLASAGTPASSEEHTSELQSRGHL